MKILDVIYDGPKDVKCVNSVNGLLKQNITNSYLFENVYFQMTLMGDNYVDMLCRHMWETMYIRRKDGLSHIIGDGRFCLMISLYEALSMLSQSLPPVLKIKLNTFETVKQIESLLHESFVDTSSDNNYNYYLSILKDTTRLGGINEPKMDISKINKLKKVSTDSLICQVVSSTNRIEHMISDNPTVEYEGAVDRTQLLFFTKHQSDLLRLLKYVEHYGLLILSINVDNDGYYVMAYLPQHNVFERSNEYDLNHVIKASYKKFMK